MSTAFVQAGSFLTNSVSSTSIQISLTGVTSGNLIVLGGSAVGVSITGVTDSQSNTYTQIDANSEVRDFYAKNVTGGNITITAALSAAATQRSLIAHEVSGCDLVAPLDGHNATLYNPGSAGTDAAASGSFTPSIDGCYLWGLYWDVGNTANTLTAGTNYTARVTSNPAVGVIGHCSVDRIQAASTATQTLITVTGGNFTGVMMGAAFKPAGANRDLLLRGVG